MPVGLAERESSARFFIAAYCRGIVLEARTSGAHGGGFGVVAPGAVSRDVLHKCLQQRRVERARDREWAASECSAPAGGPALLGHAGSAESMRPQREAHMKRKATRRGSATHATAARTYEMLKFTAKKYCARAESMRPCTGAVSSHPLASSRRRHTLRMRRRFAFRTPSPLHPPSRVSFHQPTRRPPLFRFVAYTTAFRFTGTKL